MFHSTSPSPLTQISLQAGVGTSFHGVGVDACVSDRLAKLGWVLQFGRQLDYPRLLDTSLLGADYSPNNCIVVAGDGYLLSADHKLQVMTLCVTPDLDRASDITTAVQQAVFGGKLLETPDPLKAFLKAQYVPAPDDKQLAGIFVLEKKEVVGKESIKRGDRLYIPINEPTSASDELLEKAISVWGLETLGYELNQSQKDYKAAHQSAEAALSYIKERSRLEVVNTSSGPMFLVGEKGCKDSEMRYLASVIPGRIYERQGGDKSPTTGLVRTLVNKFNDKILASMTESSYSFSALAVFGAHAEFKDGICTFSERRGASMTYDVPEEEVFKVDLKKNSTPDTEQFRESLKSITDGDRYLTWSIWPRAFVNIGDQGNARCGIGSVTGMSSELNFYVPKGESANFLLVSGSDNSAYLSMLYGVTISRSAAGEYSFKPYKPENEIVVLSKEGSTSYPAEIISKLV